MVLATSSPYVGEDSRKIKSLSDEDIDGLLTGKGMGFAKAAELNHYPGPRHVLDLANELQLSNHQISATNEIFEKMRQDAIRLGKDLIGHENKLDELFSSQKVSEESLEDVLLKIGEAQARLRGVHLSAHLEMKQLLSQHQIMMYDQLRGYSNGTGNHSHTH
ncbi:MAG: hypothetical protein R3F37_15845 [Candidatus Competibacteraceae bacterium]